MIAIESWGFFLLTGLGGGVLIGLGALLLLAGLGRVAGISGLLGASLGGEFGTAFWRPAFLVGLIAAPLGLGLLLGGPVEVRIEAAGPLLVLAGILVGFGTRLGSGCTSGHGVCGLARLSPRSLVATVTFMLVAGLTVFLLRHIL